MWNDFPRQLRVAFIIWLLAVTINTVLGTFYLYAIINMGLIMPILVTGFVYSAIYSFPVFILILVIINRCAAKKVNGLFLFRAVFIGGLLLTIGVWKLFLLLSVDTLNEQFEFLVIALLSATLSIAFQHRSLFKLATREKPYQYFPEGPAGSQ